MDYRQKYLKYKDKYIQLKKNMLGGSGGNLNNQEPLDTKNFELEQQNLILSKLNTFCESFNNTQCINTNGQITINGNKWEWNNIKKTFGSKPDIMNKYFKFRTEIVDSLIDNIFKFFNCTNVSCQKNASGSVGADANLFSDYDLTIVNQNLKTSQMIQVFNSVIFNVFNSTPAEAFDTNLYGYSSIIPNTSFFKNKLTWSPVPFDNTKYYLPVKQVNLQQDEWALKRLVTFVHKSGLTVNSREIISWLNLPENKINELSYTTRADYYIDKMQDFELSLVSNNDTSTTRLPLDLAQNDMANKLSYMNFYGDETYFTVGSFLHVVGTMFYFRSKSDNEKIQILTEQQLIHSMIENLAYFIHTMDAKNNNVIIGAKYLERFFSAYKLFLIKKNISVIDQIDQILNLLNIIKNFYRNRTDQEITDYEKKINPNLTVVNVENSKQNKVSQLDELFILMNPNDTNLSMLSKSNKYQFYIYELVCIIKSCLSKELTNIQIDNSNPNNIIFSL